MAVQKIILIRIQNTIGASASEIRAGSSNRAKNQKAEFSYASKINYWVSEWKKPEWYVPCKKPRSGDRELIFKDLPALIFSGFF